MGWRDSEHTERTNLSDFVNTINDYENDGDYGSPRRNAPVYESDSEDEGVYEEDEDDEGSYEDEETYDEETYEEVTTYNGEDDDDDEYEEDDDEYEEGDDDEYEEGDDDEYEEGDDDEYEEGDNEEEYEEGDNDEEYEEGDDDDDDEEYEGEDDGEEYETAEGEYEGADDDEYGDEYEGEEDDDYEGEEDDYEGEEGEDDDYEGDDVDYEGEDIDEEDGYDDEEVSEEYSGAQDEDEDDVGEEFTEEGESYDEDRSYGDDEDRSEELEEGSFADEDERYDEDEDEEDPDDEDEFAEDDDSFAGDSSGSEDESDYDDEEDEDGWDDEGDEESESFEDNLEKDSFSNGFDSYAPDSYAFGQSIGDDDSEDDFRDEESVNIYSKPRFSTAVVDTRQPQVSHREAGINKRQGRYSRWLLLAGALVCCAVAAMMTIYFLGIGPFADEPAAPTQADTEAPSSVPTLVENTTSVEPSSLPSESPPLELQEYILIPNYQVVVPFGISNGVTTERLSIDLIALMDILAPEVLAETTATSRRGLRGVARYLQLQSIELPTLIESVIPIECPVLVPPNSLCVDVDAIVVILASNLTPEEFTAYQDALEEALLQGRLEAGAEGLGIEYEIVVSSVGSSSTLVPSNGTDTSAPSSYDGNSTAVPTTILAPSSAPSTIIPEIPSQSPSSGNQATIVPSALPSQGPSSFQGPTIPVFVIAGGANAVGWGDVNNLVTLSFTDPSNGLGRYISPQFTPVQLPDVFVTFDNSYGRFQRTIEGGLSYEYGIDFAHFGPELGFGFDLADAFDESILIVKGAGDGTLAGPWLPPSSSAGNPGEFYTQLLADINDSISRAEEITGQAQRAALAGFVWVHGNLDSKNDADLGTYESNLINLIDDLRNDLSEPNLPIVIAELGTQGNAPDAAQQEMRSIQARVAASKGNTTLTNTAQFVTGFDPNDPFSVPLPGNADLYYGRADVVDSIGRQLATDMLELVAGGVGTVVI